MQPCFCALAFQSETLESDVFTDISCKNSLLVKMVVFGARELFWSRSQTLDVNIWIPNRDVVAPCQIEVDVIDQLRSLCGMC